VGGGDPARRRFVGGGAQRRALFITAYLLPSTSATTRFFDVTVLGLVGGAPGGETPRTSATTTQAQASYVAGSPVPLPLPPGPPVRLD